MNEKYLEIKEVVNKNIEKYSNIAFDINDTLAENPEISCEEVESSKKIVKELVKQGFVVDYPFAGFDTGFKASYGKQGRSRKIAIMAEYDALPGIGHACGHCVSGSISILAGIALKELQDEIDADIHIIGTPAEETLGAKVVMVNDGVFDEYDMAIMIHLYDKNVIKPNALALDAYNYTFRGKAAHASAAPWDGINAFNAVQLMFHGMDMLRQHVKPDVKMHGIIRYPGEAPNIVPEKCVAEIYARANDRKYLNEVTEKLKNCAEGAAIATGATWEREPTDNFFDNIKSNTTGEKVLTEIYNELGLEISSSKDDVFGSTDVGNVSMVCPAFQPTLQLVERGIATHTKEFEKAVHGESAHKAIVLGAKVIAFHIGRVFTDKNIFENMKKDFSEN